MQSKDIKMEPKHTFSDMPVLLPVNDSVTAPKVTYNNAVT